MNLKDIKEFSKQISANIESFYYYEGNPWFYAILKLQGEDVIIGLNRCFNLNIRS